MNDVPTVARAATDDEVWTRVRESSRRRKIQPPTLRFNPNAWAKLVYLRDCGDTEIGGFAVSAKDDPLLVEDVRLVNQRCTPVSVQFDDQSVADFFDEQVDLGRKPEEFARIWVHTHPGQSPLPSGMDEQTFARCFGRANWTVMFILAQEGQTYARLRFNVGPGGAMVIPVEVDFELSFKGSDQEVWSEEYCRHVVDTNALRKGLLDEVWETVDPARPPDEFMDAWADYAGEESAGDDENDDAGVAQHNPLMEYEPDDIPY